MIKSLLDLDLYKLTMQIFAFHQFPNVTVRYEFICRNKGIDFRPHLKRIEQEIESFKHLRFTADEIGYLQSLPYMKQDYLDFLFGYRNDNNRYEIYIDDNNDLHIVIVGAWLGCILAETCILSIVNEVYFTNGKDRTTIEKLYAVGREKTNAKIDAINRYNVTKSGTDIFQMLEFGTRRRFSFEWQREVIQMLKSGCGNALLGTSNVLLAKEFGLKPLGTMAHELICLHQAIVHPQDSQRVALENWIKVHNGDLAIALSDTLGLKSFIKDFNYGLSKAYDGVRIDSGDNIEAYNTFVAHYESLGIDPETKTIIFSDGLTIDKAIDIKEKTPKMKSIFGIGTHISNDLGLEPLQIVMKLVSVNGRPVAKLSDSKGKTMCNDPIYLEYLKKVFNIQ